MRPSSLVSSVCPLAKPAKMRRICVNQRAREHWKRSNSKQVGGICERVHEMRPMPRGRTGPQVRKDVVKEDTPAARG
jgi:hypothetical protein